MSGKLYPPYLESSLPAQVGGVFGIPFQPNRATQLEDYTVMKACIKTVSTNWQVGEILTSERVENSIAYFPVADPSLFTPGQFYKIQIAGVVNEVVGYYSTIGVFKYTTIPNLEMTINNYNFIGTYNQDGGDITEKVYSYCFDLYENDNIIFTSGELIHDSSSDLEKSESNDTWELKEYFIQDNSQNYYIEYTVKTINNYIKSMKVELPKISYSGVDFSHDLIGYNNYENGYIEIRLKQNSQNPKSLNGNFLLCRSSNLDNHQAIVRIKEFELSSSNTSECVLQDFSVEQGIEYQYYITEITTSGWSNWKTLDTIIKADFEDIFLYDGQRQLKIQFNPQVSSFKTVLQETKIDTIGSQYPFIYRNGNIEYKQFPVGGLISYLMDNDELFMQKNNFGFFGTEENRDQSPSLRPGFDNVFYPNSTQLESYNLARERLFKIEVLNWLNNGEIKLFRSPTEGNFLIRLTGVSLSPNVTLGRMLHTFTATAYEIAECSISNLQSKGFIK